MRGQGARDADALTLPAAEGVGIAIQMAHIQADQVGQLSNPVFQFPAADALRPQRFADDIEHRHARRQRREGVLKDHLHFFA